MCKHFRFMYVVEKIRNDLPGTWNMSLRGGHYIDGVNHSQSTISSVCQCVWLGIGMSDHISFKLSQHYKYNKFIEDFCGKVRVGPVMQMLKKYKPPMLHLKL